MQKHIILLSCGAFLASSVSLAQSSVELYGVTCQAESYLGMQCYDTTDYHPHWLLDLAALRESYREVAQQAYNTPNSPDTRALFEKVKKDKVPVISSFRTYENIHIEYESVSNDMPHVHKANAIIREIDGMENRIEQRLDRAEKEKNKLVMTNKYDTVSFSSSLIQKTEEKTRENNRYMRYQTQYKKPQQWSTYTLGAQTVETHESAESVFITDLTLALDAYQKGTITELQLRQYTSFLLSR